ncbi:PQQ-binding-like beta-propeller repeat protein [Microbacterium pumilum]|uniref:Pyrrolo-quinoline quinone repeat domain-containing protein n=1 Tax=Microbacterium pumilum TaxID=344165 RepID=A0ABN2SB40_9MICO
MTRRSRRRAVAWVAVVGAVVVGSAGLVAASDPRGPELGGAAAAYVPEDGAADWVQIEGQSGPQQRENGVTVAVPVLFELPEIARTAAIAGYTEDELRTARHWTVRTTPADVAGGQSFVTTDLYSVTAAGVRLVMSLGAANSFVFQPGPVVLAPDVRDGASWTSEGEGWWVSAPQPGEETPAVQVSYSGVYSAGAVRDDFLAEHDGQDCLQVDGRLELVEATTPASGEVVFDEAVLWCPARGAVASVTSVGGGAPVRSGPADPAPFDAPVTTVAAYDWPDDWAVHPLTVAHVDPLFGETPLALTPALQPVTLGATLAVPDGNTGSVGLFARDGDVLRRTAILRPGGDVSVLGAAEGVLLAATTQRNIVAYTTDGIRRWVAPIGDVLVAPPIASGTGNVLIAGVDGRVRALDAGTGEEVWATDVSPDALDGLFRADDAAVTVDRAGRVTALSLSDGAVRWSAEEENLDALTTTDDAVFIARDNSLVRRDAATGTLAWSSPTDTGADGVAAVGDAIVVLTWSDVRAYAAGTGAPLWRAAGADRAVTDGDVIVLDGRGPTRVLDAGGRGEADFDIEPEGLGSARFLVGDADGAWVIDSISGTTWIGR